MFDVLVAGELNVDLIFNQLESFPVMGKEILANRMDLVLGSSSAIFASNLSSLGSKVAFTGMIGNDAFGTLVLSSLESKKVDTGYIIESAEHSTGATMVMNIDNDRAMLTYPGAMSHMSADRITDEMLQNARHLHISSIFLQPGLKKDIVKLMKKAKSLGLTTSLDPQWDPAELWDINWKELLQYVDIFLPNRQEFLLLSGEKDLQQGFEKLSSAGNTLVVKDGINGAFLHVDGTTSHLPAFINPHVVDAIGAGDSFDAGFISRFIQGTPLLECLGFANLMGALNTTAVGGTGAFADMGVIRSKALELFNVKI